MTNAGKIIAFIIGLIVVLGLALWLFERADKVNNGNNNGNNNEDPTPQHELIRVESPEPNDSVASPLTVTGEARGNWYFEASFPIQVEDANGTVFGFGFAEAQGDWMTEEFVPFEGTITFPAPPTATGTIVFMKDNPSGLPENDDEFRVPVSFSDYTNAGQNGQQNEQREISLFFYNESADTDADGNVMCSADSVEAVTRTIPATQTPIQEAIRQVLRGELTEAERNRGLSTEFPLEGVTLEGANLRDGILTLEINDPNNQTSGGSCRVGILSAQIIETAKQFPEVQEVRFIPEEVFQP